MNDLYTNRNDSIFVYHTNYLSYSHESVNPVHINILNDSHTNETDLDFVSHTNYLFFWVWTLFRFTETDWIISTQIWLIQITNVRQTNHSFESNLSKESVNQVYKTRLNVSDTKRTDAVFDSHMILSKTFQWISSQIWTK